MRAATIIILYSSLMLSAIFQAEARFDLRDKTISKLMGIDQDSSFTLAKSLELSAQEENQPYYECKALYFQGKILNNKNLKGEAFVTYSTALTKVRPILNQGLREKELYVRLLINSSIILRKHHEYTLGLQYLEEALSYTKKHHLDNMLWYTYYGIADHHAVQAHDFHLAINYLDSALQRAVLEKDIERQLNTLNEIGLRYTDLKEFDKARDYFLCNLRTDQHEHESYEFYKRLSLHNIGDTYMQSGNYKEAEIYLSQASQTSTIARLEFLTLMDLCEVYFNLGEFDKSELYGLKAARLYEEIGTLPINYKLFVHLSSLYNTLGDYQKSFYYSQKHIAEAKKFLATQHDLTHSKDTSEMVSLASSFLYMIDKENGNNYQRLLTILMTCLMLILVLGSFGSGIIHWSRKIDFGQH